MNRYPVDISTLRAGICNKMVIDKVIVNQLNYKGFYSNIE